MCQLAILRHSGKVDRLNADFRAGDLNGGYGENPAERCGRFGFAKRHVALQQAVKKENPRRRQCH